MPTLPPNWKLALTEELKKPYVAKLHAFLDKERGSGLEIFPPDQLLFSALEKTQLEKVKVVIVGQDPYHGPGQAHGLSFSVMKGVRPPPSLQNIFKELKSDLGIDAPNHGCLDSWAEQGVLLLNATLSVQSGKPLSHAKQGWEEFTDAIIDIVATQQQHVVFLLWGKYAQDKCARIQSLKSDRHCILKAPHPSPFSAHSGFLGCRHFSQANAFLQKCGMDPINWQLGIIQE